MANRTQRTASTERQLAQHHRAEHDDITRRLADAEGQLQRLDAVIQDRELQLDAATSEWLKGIVREELEEFNREREDTKGLIAGFRQQLQQFDGRLNAVEKRVAGIGGHVDGLQAHSEAHATAITELQHRLRGGWWQPIVAGIGAFFIAWLFLEALGNFPLWRDLVLSGAAGLIIAGIVAGLVGGGAFHGVTLVHAGAAAGVNTTPAQPPAPAPAAPTPAQVAVPPQPVVLTPDAVIPPPPPTGTQFQTVQAAAAASASTN